MFIKIGDTEYCIDDFNHPGGSVINYLKYKIVGYWQAVVECFRNLKDIGKYYSNKKRVRFK
tara:strand:+ start:196 stop:378 length:183 start_codon:yes stop_codon:yes gene_type:complete